MAKNKDKKIQDREDKILEGADFQSKTLNGSQVASEDEVESTDLEKLAGNDNLAEIEDADDVAFGAEHNTDYGGLYKRSGDTVLDQDSDSPPAGVAGHPGIDEDTA